MPTRCVIGTVETPNLTFPIVVPSEAFKPEAIPVLCAFALGVVLCYVAIKA